MSMSYKQQLSDLDRDGSRSVTAQIVDVFAHAIERGELSAGDKLPPTRELAEVAAVNHLTAARAYRRLAEMGLVAGRVGSGTYVRGGASTGADPDRSPDDDSWQHYALPDDDSSAGDRVLADMMRAAQRSDGLPLSVGYPGAGLLPTDELAAITAEVFEAEGPRALQYDTAQGVAELREQLALLGGRRDCPDSADHIVVTAGARQGLTLVTRAVLRPGDAVACESPTFFGALEAIRAAGAEALPVPTDDDGLDTEALEALLRRHEIRLVFLQPQMHNPTGRDLSRDRAEHLIALSRRHGFFVFEDGVYADLRIEGSARPRLRSRAPERVIYVESFSKTLGGGLRLGWVAASGPVLERIAREKRRDDIHCVTLTQLAIARFLARGRYEDHLERAIPFHAERRDALVDAVVRELGAVASFVRPLGGGHMWVTLDEAVDERDLYEAAAEQGVDYVPGIAVMPERPRATHMRLSFSYLDPDELREAVRRLGVAVRAARRRSSAAPAALPLA
jgi:DNA-binding transcriptional MocR family regulator